LPKPCADLDRAMMLPELKFSLDGFELRDHPLLRRDPPNDEWSGGEPPTEVGETQERESFRLSLATPLSVSSGVPPELDQSCLIRVKFKPDLPQPLPKLCKEAIGIGSILETQHKIIGVSNNHDGARCHFLAPGFDPQIEDVMQIDIREQRRCHCALRSTYLGFRPLAIFRHSRLQPFLDQAKNAAIGHPVLDKLHRPFVAHVVEEPANVRV